MPIVAGSRVPHAGNLASSTGAAGFPWKPLVRNYKPNVVDKIVFLGKVTIAVAAVASRVGVPRGHPARHGQGQPTGRPGKVR
jgi:hypothetical protein